MILCIETATRVCSAALCREGKPPGVKESHEQKSHASSLTVFIQDILEENSLTTGDLDAVAVSKGPGSYTGLRIGVSVAKGIAYASGLPLVAIPTTLSMYYGGKRLGDYDYYCPMIDARRMEVYTAVYDREGNEIKEISAEIITEVSFSEILDRGSMLFFGDGAGKSSELIKHPSATFNDSFTISSTDMCLPAFEAYKNKRFEDVAYFEPFYLKDFIATIPRKNILGNKE